MNKTDIYGNYHFNQNLSFQSSKIIDLACLHFQISQEELFLKCRKKSIIDIRNIIYFILKKEFKISYYRIGKIFNKHHASIMHGVKKIENELRLYEDTINKYNSFYNFMGEKI